MSTFDVKIRRIGVIETHENAEKLELVAIGGYRAVVQKGVHAVGDLILYIPDEAVFTEISVAEKLGVAAYLTGKEKNRVKPIRLRGRLSQGIVLPLHVLKDYIHQEFDSHATTRVSKVPEIQEGDDFAEFLKMVKYEEPIPIEMAGKVRRWPDFVPHYDLENIKRPESQDLIHDGEEVVVTEKIHGTNITVAIGPGLNEDERAFVCSRNNALQESATNLYWRAAEKYDLIDHVTSYRKMVKGPVFSKMVHKYPSEISETEWDLCAVEQEKQTVSLHGEVYGTQDLKYSIVPGDLGFVSFDIYVNGERLKYDDFALVCDVFSINTAPVIYRGPYNYELIVGLIEGKSKIDGKTMMEGCVVEPASGRTDEDGNPIKLKFISEQYLARKGGTELH